MTVIRYIILILCLFRVDFSSAQEKKLPWKNEDFEAYLTSKHITFKNNADGSVYSDSIKDLYKKYFLDFIKHDKKVRLEANPYLRVNEVYAIYNNSSSVDLVIYTDEGSICLRQVIMDGKNLSFPENGVVKILEAIKARHFGFFKIEEDQIVSENRYYISSKERYNYLSGTIRNDTIQFSKQYWSKKFQSYEKNKWSRVKKVDYKMIYQPGLKAEKYNYQEIYDYKITGEFYLEALKDKW